MKTSPVKGSRPRPSCTRRARPCMPLRMSVWPVAIQIRTPLGTGIIAAPAKPPSPAMPARSPRGSPASRSTAQLSSDSLVGTHFGLALPVHACNGLMDGAVEMIGVGEGLVSKKVTLQITPGSLDVVEFRGVFWQPFDDEPGPRRQSGLGSLAGMDGAIIEDKDDGFLVAARAWSVDRLNPVEEGDAVAAALGRAGADDQLVGGEIEGAKHRHLARLAGRLHPQIGSPLGPGAGEIGVGQSLGLVLEQQYDLPGFGLLLQQTQAQAGPLNRLGVLPPLQRVPWPAPCEPPFLRITTLSRDFEICCPVRFSISACRRYKVQFGRSDTPGANTSSTTDKAARALTGSGPHALRPRNPATPSRPKIQRQCRTLSGCAQNAAAIRSL